MKKKYVYSIVIIFLVGIGLNYIGIFGLGFWSMSKQNEREQKRNARQISQEEWVAEQQYENHYVPKIDSLLKENPKLAINYIDKIIKKYPKKDLLNIYKGMGLYKLDSFELAHQEFRKAMQKSGYEYPAALGNSGWALAKMERYDEAIFEFKKAIKENSSYVYDLAEVYEMKGDFSSAIELYKKEVEKIETRDPLKAKIDSNIVKQINELKEKIVELNKK